MAERLFSDEDVKANNALIQSELGAVVATFTIKSLPKGAAPENIRQKWIGLSLPIRETFIGDIGRRGLLFDEISRRLVENKSIVRVSILDAVLALDEHDSDAARWWVRSGFVRRDPYDTFAFHGNEGTIGHLEGPSKWLPDDDSASPQF